jgi:N-acetylmuramoyl-L-alanine amidase
MEIKDHLIRGDLVKKMIKSPNHSGEFKSGDLDTIVVHYTSGPARPAINTLTNPRVRASAHLVIDRDGSIIQLIPFNLIAWHAGKSSYGGRVGFNKYSIGIEIVNSGVLTKSGNVFRSWFGSAYNPSDVIEAIHRNQRVPRYWHIYTEEQIQVVTDICRLLIDTYNIKNILGHEEIAPLRKVDPGPAFPLDKLRDSLLIGRRDENAPEDLRDTGRISANSLNIRSAPDSTGEKIAKPLSRGTKVTILDEANGWYKISTRIEGWVFGKYVDSV